MGQLLFALKYNKIHTDFYLRLQDQKKNNGFDHWSGFVCKKIYIYIYIYIFIYFFETF